jgi:NAD(P)-dependent dehydrogenase (short-subunit alcohol dehydrogenase family)
MSKIAIVTGGSRGLGRDMALSLAKKGNDVIITYNSNSEAANEVVSAIEELGQKATAIKLNTGDTKSFDAFYSEVKAALRETFGKDNFDFLINNAGVALYQPFESTTEEQLEEIFTIHYKGVFFLTQKALPLINDGGRIVNISSGLARVSFPGSSAYGSIKGAVETLTRYMAKELGARGITANVVAPGAIATDFGGGHVRNTPALQEQLKSVTPLNRIGQADDIGGVVAFLCSEDAKWVNGQRIEASGGMFL